MLERVLAAPVYKNLASFIEGESTAPVKTNNSGPDIQGNSAPVYQALAQPTLSALAKLGDPSIPKLSSAPVAEKLNISGPVEGKLPLSKTVQPISASLPRLSAPSKPGCSHPLGLGHSTVKKGKSMTGKENISGVSVGAVMLHKMKNFPYWPVKITDIKDGR